MARHIWHSRELPSAHLQAAGSQPGSGSTQEGPEAVTIQKCARKGWNLRLPPASLMINSHVQNYELTGTHWWTEPKSWKGVPAPLWVPGRFQLKRALTGKPMGQFLSNFKIQSLFHTRSLLSGKSFYLRVLAFSPFGDVAWPESLTSSLVRIPPVCQVFHMES